MSATTGPDSGRVRAVQGRRRSSAAGPHDHTPTRAEELADALADELLDDGTVYRSCPCGHAPSRQACIAGGCTCHDTTRATDTTPEGKR